MADPFVNDDIIQLVKVGGPDIEYALTVYFNGGPISVSVKEFDKAGTIFPDGPARVTVFSADPFFRKPNYYIASGALQFRFFPGGGVSKSALITALFTNMFAPGITPGPAHFRLQLSSPANPVAPRPVDVAGDVDPGHTQNVVLTILQ